MKRIKQLIVVAMFAVGLGLVALPAQVGAVSAIDDAFCNDPLNKDAVVCKGKNDSVKDLIAAGVNTLLFLIGVAAVIVIIIGAITYTTSAGNEQNIVKAKNMILYAVIGLVIAFSAYAIVNWVVKAFA
jgi:hypothetical protein